MDVCGFEVAHPVCYETSGGCDSACQLAGLKNKAFQESPRRRSAGTLFPRTASKAFHCDFSFFKKWFIYFYFWLYWVFVAARRLSLVVAGGGFSVSCCVGFSLWWPLLLRSTGSRARRLSRCNAWALERMLSGCGPWTQLLHDMWSLPASGIELMSLALAGGFLGTVTPGKSTFSLNNHSIKEGRWLWWEARMNKQEIWEDETESFQGKVYACVLA